MILFSWDDYHPDNLKVAELFKKYGIHCIWFIECGGNEKHEQIKAIEDIGYEIGCHVFEFGSHTVNHRFLRELPFKDQHYEIFESKKVLETFLEKPVEWFCYPRGRYNEITKQLVKKAGYKYARTTDVFNKNLDDDFAKSTTVHLFPRKEYTGRDPFELAEWWIDDQTKYLNDPYVHFWGHTKEIIEYNYWDKLEGLCKKIQECQKS